METNGIEPRIRAERSDEAFEPDGRERAAFGGIAAGVVGGVVLSAYMLVTNLVSGRDPWVALKIAALPFFDLERVVRPGFEVVPVLLGVATHFAVSVAWGLLFALIFYGLRKPMTVAAGAIWGIVVWAVMSYVALPVVGATEIVRSTPVAIALLEHMLFGVAVALAFLPFQRTRGLPAARPPIVGPTTF
jgi:hypothetical protein